MDFYPRGDLGDSSQRDDSGSSFFADNSFVRYRPDTRRAGRSGKLEDMPPGNDQPVDPDSADLKDGVEAILGRVEYLLDTCRKKYEEFCGPENTNLINIALNEAFDMIVLFAMNMLRFYVSWIESFRKDWLKLMFQKIVR